MPRQARLDAPGTLHHVIVRGIEKRRIFDDETDRQNYLNRLAELSSDTNTRIYAWALMSNHTHILLRSSEIGLSTFMRRLLTGYAIFYNRRHKRWGHLFQNRYKSIICDEDSYFKELVRYIHLNPLRADLVSSFADLNKYRWCGHSSIIGKVANTWQDTEYVLNWFGKSECEAQRAYSKFVTQGIPQGRRPDLTGGGLVRSMGGWSAVKAMRSTGEREVYDARILGGGQFVEQVINEAEDKIKYQLPRENKQRKIDDFIKRVCESKNIAVEELKSGSRRRIVSRIRAEIAIQLVKEHGVSLAEAARQLGVSTPAISNIVQRAN